MYLHEAPLGCTTECSLVGLHAGVIWRGDSIIDGVPKTLDALRALVNFPKHVLFQE
jgi:hypothetical protein